MSNYFSPKALFLLFLLFFGGFYSCCEEPTPLYFEPKRMAGLADGCGYWLEDANDQYSRLEDVQSLSKFVSKIHASLARQFLPF